MISEFIFQWTYKVKNIEQMIYEGNKTIWSGITSKGFVYLSFR